jgi:acetyltransferase-like isoleucine patch superfamily enzyme
MNKPELLEVLLFHLAGKRNFIRTKMRLMCLKPCCVSIDSTARINIEKRLFFNAQYRFKRSRHNTFAGLIACEKNSTLDVKNFTAFAGSRIVVNEGAHLSLGNSSMNYFSTIECFDDISIGDDTVISEHVTIRDSDDHSILRDGYVSHAPISIGNHVWIGLNATILKGVSIGDGSIVAAGAVVTKNVPARCLVGGVPSRIIRENIEWAKSRGR